MSNLTIAFGGTDVLFNKSQISTSAKTETRVAEDQVLPAQKIVNVNVCVYGLRLATKQE